MVSCYLGFIRLKKENENQLTIAVSRNVMISKFCRDNFEVRILSYVKDLLISIFNSQF